MTQEDALTLLKMGKNVYLTGAAGSGKTYVLNQYISFLKYRNVNVSVTASTGIAATHINGMTIHSWSGIGVKNELSPKDISKLIDKPYLKSKFLYTKVLIIDEISMLHGFRLDMVDRICRAARDNNLPFGGIQVILCGDFFQLPPISRNGEDGRFAYDSDVWNGMDLNICYLSEQHRQKNDGILTVLNDIRETNVSEDTLELLRSRYRQEIEGSSTPTKLYTHNIDVDSINMQHLESISGKEYVYKTTSSGIVELCDLLKKSCLAPEKLVLKKNSLVMFVKNNYDEGYVNGTVGTVIGFEKGTDYPIVRTKDGDEIVASPESWQIIEDGSVKAQITQIPLRLAWSITIHKSQGMSLDAAEIDLSKSFVPGMGYVALSRVRSLKGMTLTGFNDMALKVNEEVALKDQEFVAKSEEIERYLMGLTKQEKERLQNDYIDSVKRKN